MVTHRTPVSTWAQTGLNSRVHLWGRGSLQLVKIPVGEAEVAGCPERLQAIKLRVIRVNKDSSIFIALLSYN